PFLSVFFFFFFNHTATTEIYTLSLHDALPIYHRPHQLRAHRGGARRPVDHRIIERGLRQPFAGALGALLHRGGEQQAIAIVDRRSEEHTSELQSQSNLVCRLLLEKKKTQKNNQ